MFNTRIVSTLLAKVRLESGGAPTQSYAMSPRESALQPSYDIRSAVDDSVVEVGLLSAFRVVMGMELLLSIVGWIIVRWARGETAPTPLLVSICGLALLFGYLCSEQLQERLGRYYLPLGLSAAGLLPLIDRLLFIRMWIERNNLPINEQMLSGAGWRVLALLLIPLVFTAWQYDFLKIILFVFAVLVTDLALLFGFFGFHSEFRLQIIGIVIGQSIIFLVVGYIITRMMYAQRKQRQTVHEANRQLSNYADTIEQLATSRERNRLARELHDTLAHSLSALAVQLDAVDTAWDVAPQDARALLIKAMAQTRSGLTETRRALHSLRASPLEDLGLRLAIKTLAEGQAQRAGWHLQLELADDIDSLSAELEQSIYRIVSEALNNVVRHAAATQVSLKLRWQEADLLLVIEDDGQGFDPVAQPMDRFGLMGMAERAAMINGTLAIDSSPRKGTTISLAIPNAKVGSQ